MARARGGGRRIARLLAAAAVVLAACETEQGPAVASAPRPPSDEVLELRVDVVSERPHDPSAFTQGLLLHDGWLYESTGQYGSSTVRRVDPETGEIAALHALPPRLFGEGLERVGDRLIQLTWRSQLAIVYDLATLAPVGEHRYAGPGWGLCLLSDELVRSDGTDALYFHDPDGFAVTRTVRVTLRGALLADLNELECAEGWIYANVWQRDVIVRIDPATGRVVAEIDASGLLDAAERARAGVLNGIAYDPAAGTFLVTGKYWPRLFEVIFVESR